MLVTNKTCNVWLRSSNNVKLSSDASLLGLTHEGIANFASLSDFYKNSIHHFPNIFKNRIPFIDADTSNNIGTEVVFSWANTSSISASRLITAVNSARYCGSIARVMNYHNMSYSVWLYVKNEDESKVLNLNDRDNDRKVIRWSPSSKAVSLVHMTLLARWFMSPTRIPYFQITLWTSRLLLWRK